MVRRNKRMKRKENTPINMEHERSGSTEVYDPWASIENGETVTAREVFYKSTPHEPRTKHYDKLKHKKQRISDGSAAKRVEIHRKLSRGIKRTIGDGDVVNGSPPIHTKSIKKAKMHDKGRKVNVFADVLNIRKADRNRINKKKLPCSAKMVATDDDENLEAFESDDNYDILDDEEQSAEDEYYIDEELDVEEENDATDLQVKSHKSLNHNSEELGNSLDEEDEESGEDESLSDETDEDKEMLDDEDSVVGTTLGGYREAVILEHADGDTIHPPDFDMFPFTNCDSSVTATRAFAWMVAPCDTQTFFRQFFQSNALVCKRNALDYYGNLFSTKRFVELVQNDYLEYGTNINIAEYKDGIRYTMNGKGRVYPNHLKDHIAVGRSVQFVNPQTFDDRVWYLCEVLQELFGCFVGANSYLTPASSSGFAPHWDDIDAFLLQLEGKKYWKVYAPYSIIEELPRDSSGNFTDEDMKGRILAFEGWLEAGDLLYIPRGFIHQAYTSSDVHSLHITISSGRHWSFVDLMEKLVPEAITSLAKSHYKMRKSLPIGMLDMGGVADIGYQLEEHFKEKWKAVLNQHMTVLRNSVKELCDGGIDVMAREFMRTALPPRLTEEESSLCVIGSQCDILNGECMEFRPSTKVKFIRRHGQRLIYENDQDCYVVHRMANSRLYEGRPEECFEMPSEFEGGFLALSESYPEWLSLSEMPDDMNVKQVQEFCQLLYYHGLIMVQQLPDRISRKVKRSK